MCRWRVVRLTGVVRYVWIFSEWVMGGSRYWVTFRVRESPVWKNGDVDGAHVLYCTVLWDGLRGLYVDGCLVDLMSGCECEA